MESMGASQPPNLGSNSRITCALFAERAFPRHPAAIGNCQSGPFGVWCGAQRRARATRCSHLRDIVVDLAVSVTPQSGQQDCSRFFQSTVLVPKQVFLLNSTMIGEREVAAYSVGFSGVRMHVLVSTAKHPPMQSCVLQSIIVQRMPTISKSRLVPGHLFEGLSRCRMASRLNLFFEF